MKRKITFLIAVIAALMLITQPMKAVGQTRSTSTTTFKSGTTPDAGDPLPYETGGLAWTTSIAPNGWESSSPNRGWQYTSGNSPDIKHTISNAVITNVTIVASTNYKSGKKNYISVHVGDSEFESQKELSGNNNEYSFTDDGKSGEIKVTLTSGGDSNSKSMWIKSITVTYTPTHSLTYSATEGGSITSVMNGSTSVSSGSQVAEGTTLNIVAEASSGYTFNGWTQTGTGNSFGNAANQSTTFTMGTANATMTANFIVTPSTPYFTAANVDLAYTATSGIINYSVNNSKDGGKVSAACTAGDSWISDVAVTDEDDDENTVTFKTTKNTGAQRDGIIRLTYTYDTKTTVTKDVTITQAEMPQLDTPEFTAVTAGKGKVTPTWDDVDNATSYTVRYSTSENFSTYTDVSSIESGNDITGLTNETKYYFKLKAVGDGISYRDSEWSDAVSSTPNARETITITNSAASLSSYSEYTWTVSDITGSDISGKVYACSNANGIQFNRSKTGYYLYNTTAIPGTIKSIKMTRAVSGNADLNWSLRVNTSTITSSSGGSAMGSAQSVTTSGATWDVTGDYSHFYLYISSDSGWTVISSIEITYIPKYTVTYNANAEGATGTTTDANKYAEGAIVTAKANGFTHPSSYTFNSWNTAADGSGTTYAPAATFTMGTANVILYAQWNRNDLPVNGSTHELESSTTVNEGEVVTVSSEIIIPNGITLTVDGTLVNTTAANLIIEDGGQLITSNSVAATIVRNITSAESKTVDDHWYTIASSVNAPTFVSVTNLTTDGTYDLYRYDEESYTWQNSKKIVAGNPQFSSFQNGRGYLYRKAGSEKIKYEGDVNVGDLTYTLMTYASENESVKGFNLIGNPFPHNIYKGYGGAIDESKLSDKFYYLDDNSTWQIGTYLTPIKPGMGIMVQTNSDGDITIKDDNTAATAEKAPAAKASVNEMMFTIANSQYKDAVYAVFDNGYGLYKLEHQNTEAPMAYITQNNKRYGSAMMSDDVRSFNLNFKAKALSLYTLSCKAFGEFDYVHVIDRLTGEDIDILLEGEYSFIGTPEDMENRFIVKLGSSADNNENDVFVFQNGNDIVVNGEGELQIFDVTGRMISTQRVSGIESVAKPSQTGVYIFRIVGETVKTQKIVVE